MERIVKFSTPFDKRHSNPNKDYGVGGVLCWMILKGDKGAVQFQFSTGIYLPHVLEEWKQKGYAADPEGWDVGYHSPTPMYEGQKPMGDCYLLGCECYYDGSSLRADEWYKIFLAEGDEAIWNLLGQEYEERFGA